MAETKNSNNVKSEKVLLRQREKTLKAEIKKIQVKEKARKELLKARKKAGTTFKKITKTYGYRPKLSQTLLGYSRAFDTPQQATAGRPKKIYKHTSPISGKPVPAEVYYAHMRQFKKIQARRVEDAKERQIAEYAKRGIPPSQIAQIQERIRQQKLLEQVQAQQRQIPIQQVQPTQQVPTQQPRIHQTQPEQLPDGTVVDRSTNVWRHRKGVVDTEWTAFGRRKIIRGLPSSMWN